MTFNSPLLPSLRISALVALVFAGAACTIIVDDHGDDHGHGHDAQENAWERCYDDHEDCLDDADGAMDAVISCNAALDRCTGADAEDPTGGAEESTNTSQCQEQCQEQCPQQGLAACLDDYGGCVGAAVKDYELEACNLVFHGCIEAQGATMCLPEDDAHVLCNACAEGEAELAACQGIFDTCVDPPL